MKKPWKVIEELRASSSTLVKKSIIKRENDATNDELFRGLSATYNVLSTYGIKQIPSAVNDGPGISWDDFEGLLIQLKDRTLTGNAARDSIQIMMGLSLADAWNNWYKCILEKNLRCGISYKTINDVVDDCYKIENFGCQLAHDSANHESKVSGKKLLEVKLDGCLSEEWIVEFENGQQLSIKEVVDNKLKGKIKSYNTITGKIEFNEILNWAVDGEDANEDFYEWFEIELENGMILPPLTGNHLVYLPKLKCYRRADLLEEGDEVLIDT
jgi:hypothetical protein